jgi:hypothetical protein
MNKNGELHMSENGELSHKFVDSLKFSTPGYVFEEPKVLSSNNT